MIFSFRLCVNNMCERKKEREQSEVKVKIYIITSSVSLSIYGSLSHSFLSLARSIVVLVKKA